MIDETGHDDGNELFVCSKKCGNWDDCKRQELSHFCKCIINDLNHNNMIDVSDPSERLLLSKELESLLNASWDSAHNVRILDNADTTSIKST